MTCSRVRQRLSALIDGELPSGERVELAAHLGGCPPCHALHAQLEGVDDLVDRMDAGTAPLDTERLIGRLRSELASEARTVNRRPGTVSVLPRRRFAVLGWSGLALAAAALCFVVIPATMSQRMASFAPARPATAPGERAGMVARAAEPKVAPAEQPAAPAQVLAEAPSSPSAPVATSRSQVSRPDALSSATVLARAPAAGPDTPLAGVPARAPAATAAAATAPAAPVPAANVPAAGLPVTAVPAGSLAAAPGSPGTGAVPAVALASDLDDIEQGCRRLELSIKSFAQSARQEAATTDRQLASRAWGDWE